MLTIRRARQGDKEAIWRVHGGAIIGGDVAAAPGVPGER